MKKLEQQLSEERINCGQLHEDMSAAASEKRKLLHKLGIVVVGVGMGVAQ